MTDKPNKYVCGICGKEYDTVSERNECETKCLKDRKLKEKQKADNISINNLFNNYFDELAELESLVLSINAELENYYNQYNMVYANYSVVKKLADIWLYDKTVDSKIMPGTIYNESSVYATPTAIEKFNEYLATLKQDKIDKEPSELEVQLMQKAFKDTFKDIRESISEVHRLGTPDAERPDNNMDVRNNDNLHVKIRRFKI